MVTKIVATLQDKGRTTKSRIISLIGDEIIKTKYDDIGKAKEVLKSLKVKKTSSCQIRTD